MPQLPNYERETAAHPVAMAIRLFTAQATCLVDSFDALISPFREQLSAAQEEFETFLETNKKESPDDSQDKSPHPMPLSKRTAYIVLKQRLDDAQFAFDIIPRGLLLSLIAIYDHFLRNHIKAIYKVKSELRNTIQIGYTISELLRFTSLDSSIENGIERHLDHILRSSHLAQLEWLEKLLNMKLTAEVPALPRFVEITERRNMVAHCGSVATPFYVEQCQKYGVKPGASVGELLTIDNYYFIESYNCVSEIGVKLSQSTWRKIRPDEIGLADHVLRGITYSLLVTERFELARVLLEFANSLHKHSSDQFSRIFTVNLAQCYKWLGNTEKCFEVLAKKDWTAAEPSFLLAERVLYDDFDAAEELMVNTGRNRTIPEAAFRDWPLFREFRRTEQFSRAYKQVFGKPYNPDR
jgi:hypothetical protein